MGDLARKLMAQRGGLSSHRVVVLPDFFLDHFVPLPNLQESEGHIRRIHRQGGGNLLTGPHLLRVGGNAANTAYVLGRLGVPTALVARADSTGRSLLDASLGAAGVDLSAVQEALHSASTVALEFHDGANVMLSDSGPVSDYRPEDLGPKEWELLDRADAVFVTNWSQSTKGGTALLRAVVPRARSRGSFTYLDTGDPTHRGRDALELFADDAILRHLSAWSMNENEVRHFSSLLSPSPTPRALEAEARIVAQRYPGRLDVHTREGAFSLEADRLTRVPSYPFTPLRRTGAGDAWNAGNVLGGLLGWSDRDRLTLANAVAACTLLSPTAEPPRFGDVVAWTERHADPGTA